MDIIYRKATQSDKKALYDLGVLLNEYNLAHDLRENLFWNGWETDIDKEVEEELNDPLTIIYIAETDNKTPVGYILAKNCSHCGHIEIDQLFVKDEYRGQNVGKKFIDLIINDTKRSGLSLQLEVYKSNDRAINFYKKQGFKETGTILRMDFE